VEAAVTVPMSARRRRTSADNTIEGVAVPRLDLVADVIEGLGENTAAVPAIDPVDLRQGQPPRPSEPPP
jgi:hypothetical protein